MFYFDNFIGFKVLKSDLLSEINHFFTTRNFVLKTKEKENYEISLKNREILKKEFKLKTIITPHQRHTCNIDIATLSKDEYQETDALVLKDKNIGIFLNFADCTPIILYDKLNKIGAIAHAGWRGTEQKISQKTALKLINEFSSSPKNIIALIGPSICFDCFETSEEIAKKVSSTISKEGFIKKKNDKFYADLKGINREQLFEIGVENVDVTSFCTCCNNDKFFSYRKENKTTNRMSAFICLN